MNTPDFHIDPTIHDGRKTYSVVGYDGNARVTFHCPEQSQARRLRYAIDGATGFAVDFAPVTTDYARTVLPGITAERDALRTALRALREFEAQQSRRMNDENSEHGPQPPNGDDWNELSACVIAVCRTALPEPAYVVDGSTSEDPAHSVFEGDGQFPPFAIFDVDAQENIDLPKRYVYFLSRETAEQALTKLRDGVAIEDLPTDPLHALPAGYRPLGAHEPIRPGVLAVAQADESDEDNEGQPRVTPAGSVGIVHSASDERGAWDLHFYSTGAAIRPYEFELRDPRHYHLYVRG